MAPAVRLTEQALADIQAISLFLGRHSPSLAQAVESRVFDACERLSRFPQSDRMVPELHREDTREVVVASYRLVYRVRGDTVHILTVHHGARPLDISRLV